MVLILDKKAGASSSALADTFTGSGGEEISPANESSTAAVRYAFGPTPPPDEHPNKIKQKLKEGKISLNLAETLRILPKAHPAAIETNRICLELLTKVYPSHDFRAKPIRVMLMDQPEVNACYFKGSDPITICVSKGLMQRLSSDDPKKKIPLDDLAYILAHEYTHHKIYEEHGDLGSCKLQEGICDTDPIDEILKAGLDPRSAERVQEMLSGPEFGSVNEVLRALCDPHPHAHHRQKAVAGKLSKFRMKDGFDREVEPSFLEEGHSLERHLKSAVYYNWLDHFLETSSYDNSSPAEQAQIINQTIDILLDTKSIGLYLPQLHECVRSFGSQESLSLEEKEALVLVADKTFEIICDWFPPMDLDGPHPYEQRASAWLTALKEIHNTCEVLITQGRPTDWQESLRSLWRNKQPIGKMREMADDIESFIFANSAEEIRTAAEKVLSYSWPEIKKQKWHESEYLDKRYSFARSIEMPNFRLHNGNVFGWNKSVLTAIEDLEKGSDKVAKVLLKLGVFDKRLIAAIPQELKAELYLPTNTKSVPVEFRTQPDKIIYPRYCLRATNEKALESPLNFAKEVTELDIDQDGKLRGKSSLSRPKSPPAAIIDEWVKAVREGRHREIPHSSEVEQTVLKHWTGSDEEISALKTLVLEMDKQVEHLGEGSDGRSLIDGMKRISSWACNHISIQSELPAPEFKGATVDQFAVYLSITCTRHTNDSLCTELQKLEERDPQLFKSCLLEVFVGQRLLSKNARFKKLASNLSAERQAAKGVPNYITTPLVRLITGSSLTSKEKIQVLYELSFTLENSDSNEKNRLKTSFKEPSCRSKQNLWCVLQDNPELLEKRETLDELRKVMDLRKPAPTNCQELIDLIDYAFLMNKHFGYVHAVQCLMVSESLQYLKSNELDLDEIHSFALAVSKHGFPNNPAGRELEAVLSEKLSTVPTLVIKGEDLEASIERFKFFHDQNICPAILLNSFLDDISQRIEQVESASERLELVDSLFVNEPDPKNRTSLPRTRRKIFKIFCDSFIEEFGLDDQSPEYAQNLKDRCSSLQKSLARSILHDFNSILAESVQAQEELAYQLRDQVVKLKKHDFEESRKFGGPTEALLLILKRKKDLSREYFEFLTSPLTNQSCEHIAKITQDARLSREELGLIFPDSMSKETEIVFYRDFAHSLYENFWDAHLPIRIAVVSQLLNPENKQSFRENDPLFIEILDRLFPEQESQEAAFARKHITAFIQAYKESYNREVLLMGMMVAARKHEQEDLRIGERLAILLESLGPLPIKAGQKAASDPRVPADIAGDLERLKHAANPIDYWEVHQLIARDENLKNEVARTGRILGSGSIFVVVEIELKYGAKEVVALLRENIQELVAADVNTFRRYLDNLDEGDPNIVLFKEMIEQGRQAALNETNTTLARVQHRTASQNYDDASVVVNNNTYSFAACKLTWYGETYKRMKKVEGVHFSALPAASEEEKNRKKEIAAAIAAKEFQLRLQGKATDFDRHGSNVLIEGSKITHIDFGAQEIEDPTQEDLEALGSIIGGCLIAVQNGKSVYDALVSEMNERAGSLTPYLSNFNNSLLALREYVNVLNQAELLNIIASAAGNGIHQSIEIGLEQSLKENSLKYKLGRFFRIAKKPSKLLAGFSDGSVSFTE